MYKDQRVALCGRAALQMFMISFLVIAGCKKSANMPSGGRLVQAVVKQNLGEIKRLLDEGANPNTICENGWGVLSQAANLPSTDIVQLLLAAGANVNAADKDGSTPLMHAACADRQFKETVEAYRLRNLKVLLQNGADVNAKNNRGRSALHYAARTGLESVNKLLLEAGANPNAKDNDGKGPVDMAKESGYDDVVAILKDHGATH